MKKATYSILFSAILFICFIRCEKPPSKTKAQVMQERLDDRLGRWREGVNRNCRNKVMDAAIAIVDSTLLANARFKRDTSDIPDIPGRPNRPEFIAPNDTIPVKPILQNITDQDSIKN